MFGIFKRKTKAEKLESKYKNLLEEAHSLSKIDRKKSDAKMVEANKVLEEIDQLKESE